MAISYDVDKNTTNIYKRNMKACCKFNSYKNSTKTDDSIALIKDGRFVQILNFVLDEEHDIQKVVVKIVNVIRLRHEDTDFFFKIKNINEEVEIINTNLLDRVCVRIEIAENAYIFKLPHVLLF